MHATEYTLTGFDDFLELRRILFVEQLPSTRVCGLCGVVPNRSLLLPCGHVLCQTCQDQIASEDRRCPFDGMTFVAADVVSITFQQSHLEQHRVLCAAGGKNCTFTGQLSQLRNHLLGCSRDMVRCVKCHLPVVRSAALLHYQKCTGENCPQETVSAKSIAGVVETLGGMKRDLETIRETASKENVEQHVVVNGANYLLERMTCLERDLIQVGEKFGRDGCDLLPPTAKKTTVTAGPYRAAHKPGVFILSCEFSDIYDDLDETDTNHFPSGGAHSLAGYEFNLGYRFHAQAKKEVLVSFGLSLRDGTPDGWAEWPFSKKVAILLTHPTNEKKDIRLTMNAQDPEMVKKPAPGSIKKAMWTETQNWKEIEYQGFVVRETLYVHVVFE